MMVLFLAGLLVAGWVIPPSPTGTAHEIATMYRTHAVAIRVGIFLAVVGTTMLAPFVSAISVQLARIEGRTPISAYCQLVLGGALVLEVILPLMVMATAAYRPERSDEAIRSLNDEGWLLLAGLVTTISLELVVTGLTMLGDRRPEPVFPRWAAWFNIACAVPIAFGIFDIFARSGPFAWDGALAWYAAVGTFGTWIVVMTVLLLRAVGRQESDERQVPDPGAGEFDVRAEIARLTAEVAELRRESPRESTATRSPSS
jgi:energy-converting hydrogenase Eha subunit E